MNDIVIKERYLTEEAQIALKQLRETDADITELFNAFLESFLISKKVA